MKAEFLQFRDSLLNLIQLSVFYCSTFASLFNFCGLVLEIVRRMSSTNMVRLNLEALGKSIKYKANNRGPSVEP